MGNKLLEFEFVLGEHRKATNVKRNFHHKKLKNEKFVMRYCFSTDTDFTKIIKITTIKSYKNNLNPFRPDCNSFFLFATNFYVFFRPMQNHICSP